MDCLIGGTKRVRAGRGRIDQSYTFMIQRSFADYGTANWSSFANVTPHSQEWGLFTSIGLCSTAQHPAVCKTAEREPLIDAIITIMEARMERSLVDIVL